MWLAGEIDWLAVIELSLNPQGTLEIVKLPIQ